MASCTNNCIVCDYHLTFCLIVFHQSLLPLVSVCVQIPLKYFKTASMFIKWAFWCLKSIKSSNKYLKMKMQFQVAYWISIASCKDKSASKLLRIPNKKRNGMVIYLWASLLRVFSSPAVTKCMPNTISGYLFLVLFLILHRVIAWRTAWGWTTPFMRWWVGAEHIFIRVKKLVQLIFSPEYSRMFQI